MDKKISKRMQTAIAIKEYIINSNLSVGAKLPGGKVLSKRFDCSHNVVYEALEMLQDEGIVDIIPQSGTYISQEAYENLNRQSPNWNRLSSLGWQVGIPSQANKIISSINSKGRSTSTGYLEPSFGMKGFITASMTDIQSSPDFINNLHCINYMGLPLLQKTLVNHLAKYNIHANEAEIVMYPSFAIAIEVVIKALIRAGLRIYMTESEGGTLYPIVFKSLGAEVIEIPNDEQGLDIEYLKNIYKDNRQAVLIATPLSIYKDVNITTIERQKDILDWCRQMRIPIIELDSHGSLLEKSNSLKSLDKHNNVLYLGALSLYLNYGIEVAWSVSPVNLIKRILEVKVQMLHNPLNINFLIVENLISSGRYYEFIKQLRPKMQNRVEYTKKLLQKYLSANSKWEYNEITGLFAIDVADNFFNKYTREQLNSEIILIPKYFDYTRSNNKIMLLSGCMPEDELEECIKVIGEIIEKLK